jgi:outer membrane protein OmpA-like peptidoglycan-associated protein
MNTRLAALTAAVSLAASTAFAEAYKINLHIDPGAGVDLSKTGFITGADLKIDFGVFSIGPVAPQLEAFGFGTGDNSLLVQGSLFGGAVGLRWRSLNDERGYLIPTSSNGNLAGNLWLDAHVALSNGGTGARVGFDVALGYELSLIDGLQIGPFAKFTWLNESLLMFGISFSVGGPMEAPAESDPDNDGIKGTADKCPSEPEDKDGFEDDDGCPEKDNDKDGIEDAKDKCPNEAEDKDGFQDDDGCPEKDNDQDGIEDSKDKCPNEAEDKDGFEDTDGCPEKDNDKDGIEDSKDKCPNDPEDKDGFEDDDGCPDPDNDHDGIPDTADKCPNEPETVNGIDDQDGCPEKEANVFLSNEKVVITEQIFFDTERATIKPESNKLLDSVAELLKRLPDVKKVRIEGHTDEVRDAALNMKLSQQRAEAVRDALVKRGIDKNRLDTQGFGETRPLVAEKTDAARAKNRRVEFVIVDHGK